MIIILIYNIVSALLLDFIIITAMVRGTAAVYERLSAYFILFAFVIVVMTVLSCIINKFVFSRSDKQYSDKTYCTLLIIHNALLIASFYLMLVKMRGYEAEHRFTAILCLTCSMGTFSGAFFEILLSSCDDRYAPLLLSSSILSLALMLISSFVLSPFVKIFLCAISAFIGTFPIIQFADH